MKRISILTVIIWVCFLRTTFGSSPELIRFKLRHARDDLRVSLSTEKKIVSEFNQLKASGNANPELLMYYKTYLARVREMVKENKKLVREMEAAYARYYSKKTGSLENKASQSDELSEFDISAMEGTDELGKLDRELNESLTAFDELLLVEIERIRARSSQKMKELAFEAAEAARQACQSAMNSPENEREFKEEMKQEQQTQQGQQEGYQSRKGQPEQQGQHGNFDKEGQLEKEGWENLKNEGKQKNPQGKEVQEEVREGGPVQQGQDDRLSSLQGDLEEQDGRVNGKQGDYKDGNDGNKQGNKSDKKNGGRQGTIAAGQGNGKLPTPGSPSLYESGAGQIGTVNHESSQTTPQGKQPGLVRANNKRAQYEDDDIVARQLREAAEDETNPELKEKLWNEYYEYKQGR